jgi:hypothetical protein
LSGKERELTVGSNPVGDWVAGLQGTVRQNVREARADGGACRAMAPLQTGGMAEVSRVAKLVTLLASDLFIAAVEASKERKKHSKEIFCYCGYSGGWKFQGETFIR